MSGMRVIGLTGGIACGKTTLCDTLRRAGATVVDADAISRALTARGGAALPAIRAAFGDGVFRGAALDRAALAQSVFSDETQRKTLEGILHPMIAREMQAGIDAARRRGDKAVVLDVPLLYEAGLDKLCDEIWCAYAPQKAQIERLRLRDGLTRAQALARIRSQMPARDKARRADSVVRTDGGMETAADAVLSLWHRIVEGA